MRVLFGLILICVYSAAISQTALGNEPKPKPGIERPAATKKHKILLVPFEPKMYMSQIDHKINAETKWNQQKIKANFLSGSRNVKRPNPTVSPTALPRMETI